jgi:predicted dehydrogenase
MQVIAARRGMTAIILAGAMRVKRRPDTMCAQKPRREMRSGARIRWGVLGAAKIATEKVIPAMQRGEHTVVDAIASRDLATARAAASRLGIPKAYGSYEDLLADPDIDAVYNPLPNHLHVPWTTKAAEAGKHVLCEKPIALDADEARGLLEVRDRTGVRIQEAFMVRTHPQWLKARDLVRGGRIGELRAMAGYFSYFNADPANIRNVPAYGGGALLDVGCYLINTARFLFGREPVRVIGLIDRDPAMGTDRLTSLMMDFEPGHAIGTCSTQVVWSQRVVLFGTTGRITLEIPFNAPPDRPCRLLVDPGTDLTGAAAEVIELDTCNQYTIQGDRFSKAILDGTDVPCPLEDAVRNMACIDALFRSAQTGRWERMVLDT